MVQPKTPTLKLASGYEMPLVGFGIWKVPKEKAAESVYHAIKTGYRQIDGAYDYMNSAEAGQGVRKAIADGLVKREELFITSKLWNNYHARQHALEAAKREVALWGLDYLDLYLIHFPVAQKYYPPEELQYPCFWSDAAQKHVAPLEKVPIHETWGALETLVRTKDNPFGILRSIGVANFSTQLLYDLLASARLPVSVLQVELHPYLAQPQLVAMAQEHGVAVTAYSSFGPASFVELDNKLAADAPPLFENAAVVRAAQRHGRTPAQVLLRWATQRDIVVIPKSNNLGRLEQNLDCCSFDLTKQELDEISALDKGLRFNDPVMLSTPIRIFG